MVISPEHYERVTAVTLHASISMALTRGYPTLSVRDRDQMFISIIDRLARLRGWSLRPEPVLEEESE